MLTRHTHKQLLWVDFHAPTPEEVRSVMREYDVHPLIADELLSPSARQKTERYGDFLYLVLHFPSLGRTREHVAQEIDIVVGRRVVITATYDRVPALASFASTFEASSALDKNALGSNGGHVLYLMIRKLYRGLFDEMESMRDEVGRIEERIFHGQEKEMVSDISRASRIVLDFRRTLSPHREILTSLEAAGGRIFGEEFSFYVRLLQGEYMKMQSALDELRDSLQELRETNNSLLSTKQNETMQTFTVIAFIFLPLSFIGGLFQMNTISTPIVGTHGDFWIIFSIMALFALSFFFYFKTKKWL